MKPVILFGASGLASLTRHCLVHDAGRDVAAFTVDDRYAGDQFCDGLPLVPFGSLATRFPPANFDLLVPLGWTRMNAVREARLTQARAMGYGATSYVSRRASVWPDTLIKDNVLIFENCIIQSHVDLGTNVVIRAGANIGHHSTVGSHCFIASGAVTGGGVTIGDHSFIGLGAILSNGVQIGAGCFIGAGAVVVTDTEPGRVYVGNPARRLEKRSLQVTGDESSS